MLNKNNYTPDVLDCLANLSNDEVFTPPSIVNQILDMLPQEVFESKETTFLDPFSKSGVFLREITKRLLDNQVKDYKKISNEIEKITKEAIQQAVKNGELNLEDKDYEAKARVIGDNAIKTHPNANIYLNFELDLQDALNHILTKQIYGIGITELTAQLTRRSLYCSKDASGRYSICNSFGVNSDGNIRYNPMKHTWDKANLNGTAKQGASCIYCGASSSNLDRPNDLESHAYEFIHTEKPEELFTMQFTTIIGNPPYQIGDAGAFASASPIYHKFVEQAKRLNPKYLAMIIPSRWFAGGKGLDSFRETMLNDDRIRILHDYPIGADCFPGTRIAGGVCYFLWCRDSHGDCEVFNHEGNEIKSVMKRPLLEKDADTFIRMNKAVPILRKVQAFGEDSFSELVSPRKPFGLPSDFFADPKKYNLPLVKDKKTAKTPIRIVGTYKYKTEWKYAEKNYPFPNGTEKIGKYKVFVSQVLDADFDWTKERLKPFVGYPNDACTETFLTVGEWDDEETARNVVSYMDTKFFHLLMFLKKVSHHVTSKVYKYVPVQDFSRPWTDEDLYEKYGLTAEEIEFIETHIREKWTEADYAHLINEDI